MHLPKGLFVVCALVVIAPPSLAFNEGIGRGTVEARQGPLPSGSPQLGIGSGGDIRGNAAICARPRLTAEQRAERKARREQRAAQGIQHRPRTAEQKARAAARRAARCADDRPR
jgi:hypothetical protein